MGEMQTEQFEKMLDECLNTAYNSMNEFLSAALNEHNTFFTGKYSWNRGTVLETFKNIDKKEVNGYIKEIVKKESTQIDLFYEAIKKGKNKDEICKIIPYKYLFASFCISQVSSINVNLISELFELYDTQVKIKNTSYSDEQEDESMIISEIPDEVDGEEEDTDNSTNYQCANQYGSKNRKNKDVFESSICKENKILAFEKSKDDKITNYIRLLYRTDKQKLYERSFSGKAGNKKDYEHDLYKDYLVLAGKNIIENAYKKGLINNNAKYKLKVKSEVDLSLYDSPKLQLAFIILLSDALNATANYKNRYIKMAAKDDRLEHTEASGTDLIRTVFYTYVFPKIVENNFFVNKTFLSRKYIVGNFKYSEEDKRDHVLEYGMLMNGIYKYFKEDDSFGKNKGETFEEYEKYIGIKLRKNKIIENNQEPVPFLCVIFADYYYPGTIDIWAVNEENLNEEQKNKLKTLKNRAKSRVLSFEKSFKKYLSPKNRENIFNYFIHKKNTFNSLFKNSTYKSTEPADLKELNIVKRKRKIIFDNNINFILWGKIARKYEQHDEIVKETILDSCLIYKKEFNVSYEEFLFEIRVKNAENRRYNTPSVDELKSDIADFLFLIAETYSTNLFFATEADKLTGNRLSCLYENDCKEGKLDIAQKNSIKEALRMQIDIAEIEKIFTKAFLDFTVLLYNDGIAELFLNKIIKELSKVVATPQEKKFISDLTDFIKNPTVKSFSTIDLPVLFKLFYFINKNDLNMHAMNAVKFQYFYHCYELQEGLCYYYACKTQCYKNLFTSFNNNNNLYKNDDNDVKEIFLSKAICDRVIKYISIYNNELNKEYPM